jgi:hypothetical protein
MKRITLLLGAIILVNLSACAPTENPPTPKEEKPTASLPEAPVPTTPTILSTNYIDAATALAADDFDKAKASLTALAKESNGEIKTLAQTAADTGDIAAMRAAFKPLSAAATSMELPSGYAVAFCPMYKGGSKWVQKKEDKIANPYFGKAMQTCGSFLPKG